MKSKQTRKLQRRGGSSIEKFQWHICKLLLKIIDNRYYHQFMYVVPLLNPDGYEFSRTDDRMWRQELSIFLF